MENRFTEDRNIGFRAKDKEMFAKLVKEHYRYVYSVCFGVLANVHDAEDAAQETMLKGFQKMQSLDNTERVRPWILRVARNLSIDFLRKRKRREKPVENVVEDPARQSHQSLSSQHNLEGAIKRLPQDLRVPLMMYYFDGRNARTIAENLNISHSGACQKLREARQHLHRLLTERSL